MRAGICKTKLTLFPSSHASAASCIPFPHSAAAANAAKRRMIPSCCTRQPPAFSLHGCRRNMNKWLLGGPVTLLVWGQISSCIHKWHKYRSWEVLKPAGKGALSGPVQWREAFPRAKPADVENRPVGFALIEGSRRGSSRRGRGAFGCRQAGTRPGLVTPPSRSRKIFCLSRTLAVCTHKPVPEATKTFALPWGGNAPGLSALSALRGFHCRLTVDRSAARGRGP